MTMLQLELIRLIQGERDQQVSASNRERLLLARDPEVEAPAQPTGDAGQESGSSRFAGQRSTGRPAAGSSRS